MKENLEKSISTELSESKKVLTKDNVLNKLLEKTDLWRASSMDADYRQYSSTGFSLLDKELPGKGWPTDGLTEFLHDKTGIGELRLLAPTLARMTQDQNRSVLFVSPPYIPYPPALAQAGIDLTRLIVSQPKSHKDYLWVLEKALASQSCSAVIAWPNQIHEKQIRRLQLASKDGNSWGILFRPEMSSKKTSPAELRLRLRPPTYRLNENSPSYSRERENSALIIKVLKRKGQWESGEFTIKFNDRLLRPMPDFSEMVVDQNSSTQIRKTLFNYHSHYIIQASDEHP